jgi:hypothetical protein
MSSKKKIGIYFVACDFFWTACSLWYDLDFHPRNSRPYPSALSIDALAQAILDQEHAAEDYLQITIDNHPTRDEAHEKLAEDLVNHWVETLQASAQNAYTAHFVLNYGTSLYLFYKGFLLHIAIEFNSLIQELSVELGDVLTERYEIEMDQPVVNQFIKETKLELSQVNQRIDVSDKHLNMLYDQIQNTATKLAMRWRESVHNAALELKLR